MAHRPALSAPESESELVKQLRQAQLATPDPNDTGAVWLKPVLRTLRDTQLTATTPPAQLYLTTQLLHTVATRSLVPPAKWRYNLGPVLTFALDLLPSPARPAQPAIYSSYPLVLQTLAILLREHSAVYTNYHDRLLNTLDYLAHAPTGSPHQALAPPALDVLLALCTRVGAKQPRLTRTVGRIYLAVLERGSEAGHRPRLLALRGLKAVFSEDKRALAEDLARVVTVINAVLYDNPYRLRPTSDSDVTECGWSDAVTPHVATYRAPRRVALVAQALVTLAAFGRAYPRHLPACWDQYLPESTVDVRPTLFTLLRSDPQPEVYQQTLMTLAALLDRASLVLSQADGRRRIASYTPLAVRLAHMVTEVHRRLLDLLVREPADAETQDRLMRCVQPLVLHCPYPHLDPGLPTQIAAALLPLMADLDRPLPSGQAMGLYALLLSRIPATLALLRTAQIGTLPRPATTVIASLLFDTARPTELRIEVARLYAAISRVDPTSLPLETLTPLLTQFSHAPPALQVELLQCLVARRFPAHGGDPADLPPTTTASTSPVDPDDRPSPEDWRQYIDILVLPYITGSDTVQRRAVFEFLAAFPPAAIDALHPPQYGSVAHLTLAGTEPCNPPPVQAAAYRALGFFSATRAFREDLGFVMNSLDRARTGAAATTEPSGPAVRQQAAWALANLSDALRWLHDSHPEDLAELLRIDTLCHLSELGLRLLGGDDRVRISALRLLGNLYRLLPAEWFDRYATTLVHPTLNATAKLITSGPFKVQWNACHAVGNMLAGPGFTASGVVPSCPRTGSTPLIDALLKALTTSKNLKVRRNAAVALATPTAILVYGPVARVTHAALDTLEDCINGLLDEARVGPAGRSADDTEQDRPLLRQLLALAEMNRPGRSSLHEPTQRLLLATLDLFQHFRGLLALPESNPPAHGAAVADLDLGAQVEAKLAALGLLPAPLQ
ncbi:hypothetical protein IWQ60_010320 [Tieghemiomyces parasiticus]|uniref:DUF4042 domain-containing protein n=1 Tax=Tieghemiomyces parasiticus TaxID=78921 RepID=A0A9W8DN37_9FUNG|nr:hypothetical protein IWQ60_010320 [Tieghemiomyces parasiticus]